MLPQFHFLLASQQTPKVAYCANQVEMMTGIIYMYIIQLIICICKWYKSVFVYPNLLSLPPPSPLFNGILGPGIWGEGEEMLKTLCGVASNPL